MATTSCIRASYEVKSQYNDLKAVTDVDGDGGYITADFVPVLIDCAQKHGAKCSTVWIGERDYTLVEFHKAFHDAAELSHV